MFNFDFRGISISASFHMDERIYKDAGGHARTRFDREVSVDVRFWDYDLRYGDLHELAFVKSILNYFMQAYWKRSSKEGSRIELAKVLSRKDYKGTRRHSVSLPGRRIRRITCRYRLRKKARPSRKNTLTDRR